MRPALAELEELAEGYCLEPRDIAAIAGCSILNVFYALRQGHIDALCIPGAGPGARGRRWRADVRSGLDWARGYIPHDRTSPWLDGGKKPTVEHPEAASGIGPPCAALQAAT